MSLITEDLQLPDLAWDAQTKQLLPVPGQARPATEVCQMLDQLRQMCCREGLVQKLHALQNTSSQTTRVLPWRLQVSLRHGLTFLQLMDQLKTNAYIQCRMKPWGQQRSTLAQSIQRSLPRVSTVSTSWRQSSNYDE